MAQVMAASLVEDKVQSSLFMTPFRSPEAQQLTGENTSDPPSLLLPPDDPLALARMLTDVIGLQGRQRHRARQSC